MIVIPDIAARITISDANSIPVVRRSSDRYASFVSARIPQWTSDTSAAKSRLSKPVESGLPMYRFFHGMAPGMIVPRIRVPITRSAPSRIPSTNGPIWEKSYDSSASPIRMYEPRASSQPRRSALPYPRMGSCTTRAPCAAAISRDPSVDPLSTTTTSPSIAADRIASIAASMQAATVSASFRQGITTDNTGGAAVRWPRPVASPWSSAFFMFRLRAMPLFILGNESSHRFRPNGA